MKVPLFPITYTLSFSLITLVLLQNYPSQTCMIQYWQLWTPFPKLLYSSSVMKLLTLKKLPYYTLLMYSPTMDSHRASSQIKTHDSQQQSWRSCARSWTSNRTSVWHITHRWMASQNVPTNGWNSTFTSLSTTIKTTGTNGYPGTVCPKCLAKCDHKESPCWTHHGTCALGSSDQKTCHLITTPQWVVR